MSVDLVAIYGPMERELLNVPEGRWRLDKIERDLAERWTDENGRDWPCLGCGKTGRKHGVLPVVQLTFAYGDRYSGRWDWIFNLCAPCVEAVALQPGMSLEALRQQLDGGSR